MKYMLTIVVLAYWFISPDVLQAGAAEAEIEEVYLDQRDAPRTDVFAKVRWTGSGDQPASDGTVTTVQVRSAFFGDEGVNRIQSLLLAALLSGKTVWIHFDDVPGAEKKWLTGVYLKATRNQ